MSGFKEKFPERRLVTVFQPHRYSRTQICWDEFRSCFADADILFMIDVYPAGESPIEGVNSSALVQAMDHPQAKYVSRKNDPDLKEIRAFLKPGDILLTLGAGDISKLGEVLAA